MGKNATSAEVADLFIRIPIFADDRLRGRPAWWRKAYEFLLRRRNFKTEVVSTFYKAIQDHLERDGIEVHRDSIRRAIRIMETELKLLHRDPLANQRQERLVLVMTKSVRDTIASLAEQLRQAFLRITHGRRKAPHRGSSQGSTEGNGDKSSPGCLTPDSEVPSESIQEARPAAQPVEKTANRRDFDAYCERLNAEKKTEPA